MCNRKWPTNCDPFTLNRICRIYQQKNDEKCTQIVFDRQQSDLPPIDHCFRALLFEIHSSILVRTSDQILAQNIFDFDDYSGTNKSVVYKYCKSVFVLSNDPDVWLNWLDTSSSPVTTTRKRFYPFNHIFIVAETRPALLGHQWDYMLMNVLQVFWIQVEAESIGNEEDLLKVKQIQHLPTKMKLLLDDRASKTFENDLNEFLLLGDRHRWQSFIHTRAIRSSLTDCVPYVSPIYNANRSIIG